MGFLGQLANVFTGDEDAKAARKAGKIQQDEAIRQADNLGAANQVTQGILGDAGQQAIGRFDPFAQLGQQGIDLAGFLTDPNAQADFARNNPMFQLGLQNLNEQTNQTAASRSRLSSGDTLMQLQNNATLAAQPLIDRQKQDIMNLLGIGQNAAGQQGAFGVNTAGQQAGFNQQSASDIANLLTGGAASQAAGVVGAQNARSGATGNIIDVAMMAAGVPPGTFGGGQSTSPISFGGG